MHSNNAENASESLSDVGPLKEPVGDCGEQVSPKPAARESPAKGNEGGLVEVETVQHRASFEFKDETTKKDTWRKHPGYTNVIRSKRGS
jgi:hypothetical protein